MPKYKPKPGKPEVGKTWHCPGCGFELSSRFNGEKVEFYQDNRFLAGAAGRYESVEVTCPECGGSIVFSRDELEE